MRVFKNLFGNGSKINASEVVTKNAAGEVTALDLWAWNVAAMRTANGCGLILGCRCVGVRPSIYLPLIQLEMSIEMLLCHEP